MVLLNFIYFCHLHMNYRLIVGRIWCYLLLTVDKSSSAHANFDTSFADGGKDDKLLRGKHYNCVVPNVNEMTSTIFYFNVIKDWNLLPSNST
jgi:hypothetical protein